MIKKDKFGNVENVIIVEFGNGTIKVVSSENKENGHNCLLFKQIEKTKIGHNFEPISDSDEFYPEVVIKFKNKESFDVFRFYVNLIDLNFNT